MTLLRAAAGSRAKHAPVKSFKDETVKAIDPRLPVHRTTGWVHQALIRQDVAYQAWIHA